MLRRTSYPSNVAIGIQYYDEDHKFRSGVWVKETKSFVIVRNILGELTKVPVNSVIARKKLDPFYLKKDRTLQETLDYWEEKRRCPNL